MSKHKLLPVLIVVIVFSTIAFALNSKEEFAQKLLDAKRSFPDPEYTEEQLTLNVHVENLDIEAAVVAQDAYKNGVDTLALKGYNVVKVWKTDFVYAKAAVSEDLNRIIIAFRAAMHRDVELVPCTYSPNCGKIHKGFKTAYDTVRHDILQFLTDYVLGGYEVVITGHSQGGSLATLCAMDVRQTFGTVLDSFNQFSVITFGATRVGDLQFTTKYHNLVLKTKRYVRLNSKHMPDAAALYPQSKLGYYDTTIPIYIACSDSSLLQCHAISGYIDTLRDMQAAEKNSAATLYLEDVIRENKHIRDGATTLSVDVLESKIPSVDNIDFDTSAGLISLDEELFAMSQQLLLAH